jgi:hypothetical protein
MEIIDDAKELVGLVQKVGDRDLYRKIVSLEDEIIKTTRENRQLGAKVEELESALKLKGELKRRNQFYSLDGDNKTVVKEPKQIVYRYNRDAKSEETEQDLDGDVQIPSKDAVITRKEKSWKVILIFKELSTNTNAIPIYRLFLTTI